MHGGQLEDVQREVLRQRACGTFDLDRSREGGWLGHCVCEGRSQKGGSSSDGENEPEEGEEGGPAAAAAGGAEAGDAEIGSRREEWGREAGRRWLVVAAQ